MSPRQTHVGTFNLVLMLFSFRCCYSLLMKAKARIKNHPVHPMLVVFPLGLWSFSFISDIFYLFNFGDHWRIISAYCMAGGIMGAVIAGIPGFIDFTGIRRRYERKLALWHMSLNLIAITLYSINLWIRYKYGYEVQGLPFMFSLVTIILLGISGWLGGTLVYEHRVGVLEEWEQKKSKPSLKEATEAKKPLAASAKK